MMHKRGFEAVDRTLRDIRNNNDFMGGLNVVIAGDFRQTLPVIPRGTMVDEIQACLKSLQLWQRISQMKLRVNMRVEQLDSNEAKQFADYLFDIGNGKVATAQSGKIKIGEKFGKICPTLNSLINNVYPNVEKNL